MKFFKFILILFITVSITSCSSDSEEPTITLSNANIAGTYNISKLTINSTISTTTNGVTFDVGTIDVVGDTFQVDLVMNSNGTFTSSGAYRVITKTKLISGDQFEDIEIINLNGSGNYTINATDSSITFSGTEDLLEGKLNVATFNETTIVLEKEEEVIEGNNTIDASGNFTLARQ
ncbi:hypothetical protein [Polaribacter sp. Hel1_85]|uniref:hypothetical protein n=1 Tax=Polaribacter sp. Hel1_85 TaxID=1250005 RepID=UPI00052D25B6|nr:hypothetical protein [Polaribacter sp. Hel1_85]KGL62272.1 hypothetical protein PHEL85_2063 [Polaribacter sp. Hel1_85]